MEMPLYSFIAHSTDLIPEQAAEELIEQCEKQLNGKTPNVGILFAAIDADHQLVLDILINRWPDLQLIGCTTDGELSSVEGYVEDSLLLILFCSEEIDIVSGCINNNAVNLEDECNRAYQEALEKMKKEPGLCILLSDVIRVNGETVLEKLTKATDGKIPIFGGMSADSWNFTDSKQFFYNKVSGYYSPFLIFSNNLKYSFGIDSGWEAIGELGIVTSSENNIVYEINNRPALEFYRNILGENAKPTGELPIAVYDDKGQFRFLRTSYEIYDPLTGSITYLGNVHSGSKVRITVVSRDSILEGTSVAVKNALKKYAFKNPPSIALCFSCSARRVLLGTRTKEEYQMVQEVMGTEIAIAGFYTYGELCPSELSGRNEFHNETFTVLLIG